MTREELLAALLGSGGNSRFRNVQFAAQPLSTAIGGEIPRRIGEDQARLASPPGAKTPAQAWAQVFKSGLGAYERNLEGKDRRGLIETLTAPTPTPEDRSPYLAGARKAKKEADLALPDRGLGLRDSPDLYAPESLTEYGATAQGLGLDPQQLGSFSSLDPIDTPLGKDPRMMSALIGQPITTEQEDEDFTREQSRPEALLERIQGFDPQTTYGQDLRDQMVVNTLQKQAAAKQAAELADLEHQRALEVKEVELGFKKGDKQFDKEDKLRKEFEKGTKDFIKVRDAFGRIQASASDPSAAGDLALIFNFMKVLDPGSTVREGEFATAASAAGIDQRLRAQYNKVIEGTRLGDTQRADFVNRAQKLYASQLKQYQSHEDYYRGLAETYNLDPENVVYGMGESITFENFGTGDDAKAAAENEIDLTIVPDDVDPAIWGNMTEEAQLEYHRLADERDVIF